MKIGVIIASVRPGRRADAIVNWLAHQVKKYEKMEFSMIDLKDWDFGHYNEPIEAMQGQYAHDLTKKWSAEISRYDGFLIVVPEYNRGYPSKLKDAMDYLFSEWAGKPVAFVGYGVTGAQRAIDQLGSVSIGLNMVPVHRQVNIPVYASVHEGAFTQAEQFNPQLVKVLNQLAWWTDATKKARAAHEFVK